MLARRRRPGPGEEDCARRDAMLPRSRAEPKQPASTGTRLRWNVGHALNELGCIKVFALCLARRIDAMMPGARIEEAR